MSSLTYYNMKNIFLSSLLFAAVTLSAQKKADSKKIQIVEASCGQCQFGLTGKGCDLAVKIGNQAYYVDGTSIDEHGDAHASDGFCETIRTAQVTGKVVDNRFVATSFKLVDSTKK